MMVVHCWSDGQCVYLFTSTPFDEQHCFTWRVLVWLGMMCAFCCLCRVFFIFSSRGVTRVAIVYWRIVWLVLLFRPWGYEVCVRK